MRGDASHDVCLADSGQPAQEGDYTLIEEVSPHQFVAILEEILGGLAGLAIGQCLLVRGAQAFPHFNRICHIGRHWDKKFTPELVGWNADVSKLCLWFELVALFITHFWRPFSTDTSYLEPSNFIGTTSCCDPYQACYSIVSQRIDRHACSPQVFLREGTGRPDQFEPGIFGNISWIGLERSSHIIRQFENFLGKPAQLGFQARLPLDDIRLSLQLRKEGAHRIQTSSDSTRLQLLG